MGTGRQPGDVLLQARHSRVQVVGPAAPHRKVHSEGRSIQ